MRPLQLRQLGIRPYEEVWRQMQAYTAARDSCSPDELWLVEHPPVFTQGLNGKAEHLLDPGDIPVVAVDRGGQITYHGPGQAVAYLLLDLRRLGIGVKQLVFHMEQAVIRMLGSHDITAQRRQDAPGVYVDGAKIASLGLRIRHGRSYHGVALNVALDLEPFSRINPCGYRGMPVTQLRELGVTLSVAEAASALAATLAEELGLSLHSTGPTPTKGYPLSSPESVHERTV